VFELPVSIENNKSVKQLAPAAAGGFSCFTGDLAVAETVEPFFKGSLVSFLSVRRDKNNS
jgi:hypothetical protein